MKHAFQWVRSDAVDIDGPRYKLVCPRCEESFHEVGFTATAQATMDSGWINQELLRSFSLTVQEHGDQECPG